MTRRHLRQIGRTVDARAPAVERRGDLHGYPRPQLRREQWLSLNGSWDFAIDADASLLSPDDVAWSRQIEVPFAPETSRSGVGDLDLYRAVWYRKTESLPPSVTPGDRLLLHFGAVDHEATVWVNDTLAATHVGGYTPFEIDITELLSMTPIDTIVVRAYDDPGDLAKPRGKQDWRLVPHSIWYPRTTGIWQTAWLERVPAVRIGSIKWTPTLDRWEIGVQVQITGAATRSLRVAVELRVDDIVLAEDEYLVVAGEAHRRIALSDPGIDDFRNELLWSPEAPKLIDAIVVLFDEEGREIDRVESYCALRSFAVQGDRFVLNGRPYPLRLVLDQGYWPETGMTAPDDDALRRDVELARAMGFNGVRKHQKIEDPRYLYWADRLGLLVWAEMPSAYRFTARSVDLLTREWMDVLRRDASHPCVVAWVPFNESWGVPNLADSPRERDYVRALYHLTRTLDPTRPVVGNDGWESIVTDVIGIHDYESSASRLARRYAGYEDLPKLFKRERPGGRQLVLARQAETDPPIVLSEFGGIALSRHPSLVWGYSEASDAEDLRKRYAALLDAVRSVELFAGFCYTQFADTFQEANGLLYADRTPKFPIEQIAAATRVALAQHEIMLRDAVAP
ncbi:MAG TPA: glycoside hydrolase family 2 TIM barrel-domain containing protein [Byssovorax sp.]|jgi:beta-galactosidase/beta-glucuronidase